jgi:hypothetical protein
VHHRLRGLGADDQPHLCPPLARTCCLLGRLLVAGRVELHGVVVADRERLRVHEARAHSLRDRVPVLDCKQPAQLVKRASLLFAQLRRLWFVRRLELLVPVHDLWEVAHPAHALDAEVDQHKRDGLERPPHLVRLVLHHIQYRPDPHTLRDPASLYAHVLARTPPVPSQPLALVGCQLERVHQLSLLWGCLLTRRAAHVSAGDRAHVGCRMLLGHTDRAPLACPCVPLP